MTAFCVMFCALVFVMNLVCCTIFVLSICLSLYIIRECVVYCVYGVFMYQVCEAYEGRTSQAGYGNQRGFISVQLSY